MSASDSQHIQFLSSLDLFRNLSDSALRDIAARVRAAELQVGTRIMWQGDVPDAACIVVSGMLAATVSFQEGERLLQMLGEGESIGGWELLTGDAACADVIVAQNASVLLLPRSDFHEFLRHNGDALEAVTEAVSAQARQSRLLMALHVTRVFGELDELALRDLGRELELTTLAGGEDLYRYGEAGDAMHVVISGRLQVQVPRTSGGERVVSDLGIGETVGEMALISGEPRTATVRALRDTQLARLTRSKFESFVVRHPQAAMQIVARTLVQRLKEQTARTPRREQPRSVTVFATGPDVPLRDFSARLTATLSRYGAAHELTSAGVDVALGTPGISQAPKGGAHDLRVVEWLGNQETQHDYLVYQADSSLTEWTRRCLRQADHIVVVADAYGSPELDDVESFFQASAASTPVSLVLLQRADPPSGTAKWLQQRTIERHYHVRLQSQADFDRLCRFLLRRALGLTLGGGFARGLVHAGVIRAFREVGIPIDAIGGNSMGALIAAQWAQGWDEERIVRETAGGCSACIGGMTLPLVAFKSGDKFSRLVEEFFGSTQIEDLPLPYFCVSANLNRAELKVHTQGLLSKAILASTRVPGVFPPIVYDGELHADGGVIDNVPVDVMRTIVKTGSVVGVDAITSRVFNPVADYGTVLPGWQELWSRINPFSERQQWMPNILLIMLRTIEFGGITHNRSAASSADLYLHPPLQRFRPTDFAMASEIVDIGYRYAREALEQWRSSHNRLAI